MADIDPNFYTDAASKGQSDAFNYGPGAQAERRQRIESNAKQTDFMYGSGARTARSQNTIHMGLQNELLRMTNEQYGLNNDAYGDLSRNLTATNFRNDIALAESKNRVLNSPVVMDAIQHITAQQVLTHSKEVDNEFARANAQTKIDQNNFTQQIADSSRVALQSTIAQRQGENQSKFITDFQNAFQEDARSGGGIFNQAKLFDTLSNSNLDVLQDAGPEALNRIGAVLNHPHLTDPILRQKLTSAYNTVGYISSQKNIGNVFSMLGNSENLSEGDLNFKNKLISLGIDLKNPAAVNHMKITPTQTAEGVTYSISGPQGNAPLSKQELDSSGGAQAAVTSHTTMQATQKNPITARKQIQDSLAAIEKSDLAPSMVDTYNSLVKVLGKEATPEVVSAMAPIMESFQKTIQDSNPLLSGEFAEFTEGKSLPARAIYYGSGYALMDFFTKPGLEERLASDPTAATAIRESIKFRATAGIDPDTYNAYVNALVKVNMEGNPQRYTVDLADPLRSPTQINKNIQNLRRNVRSQMVGPRMDSIPPNILKALGMDTPSAEPYLSLAMRNLKEFIRGSTAADRLSTGPIQVGTQEPVTSALGANEGVRR